MIVIGIDPGVRGAVVVLKGGDIESVEDCPFVTVRVNGKNRTRCDAAGMADLLRPFVGGDEKPHVFLEQVNAHPKQGVTSMFTFGTAYGMWLGILAAMRVPFTLVTPVAWKKATMAGMAKEKDASRVRAAQLYPDISGQLGPKTAGRADALLIAEYGRRSMGSA